MFLRITKLDEDVDAPHVELFVSYGDYSAAQDSYISDEELIKFGKEPQSFPQNLEHRVIFESGSQESNYYCYLKLRAFVYDGVGHTALEVRFENHLDAPYSATMHFHVLCEAAMLNRLGHSLESWVRSKEKEFEYSTDAA